MRSTELSPEGRTIAPKYYRSVEYSDLQKETTTSLPATFTTAERRASVRCKETCTFRHCPNDCCHDIQQEHEQHRSVQHKHCFDLTNNVDSTADPTLPSYADSEEELSLHNDDSEEWAHDIQSLCWICPKTQIPKILCQTLNHIVKCVNASESDMNTVKCLPCDPSQSTVNLCHVWRT